MKRFLQIAGFAWLVGLTALGAQNAPEHTLLLDSSLDAYLARAIEASPALAAYQERFAASLARVPQAAALPDPQLQVTHFVEPVQTRNGPQENALMLNQRLPWFGTLRNRERSASAEAQALWYAAQSQARRVALETGTAYYDYALIRRQLELVTRNLDLLHQALPTVEERVRTGRSLDSLLRLQVEVGRLEDRLASLQSQRAVIEATLRGWLVLEANAALPAPELTPIPAPEVDLAAIRAALPDENPELAMLRWRVESAEARQALARLKRYPDLTLGMNYVQIGEGTMGGADAGRDAWSVMVGVNLPIWGDANRGARDEAQAARRAAEADYQQQLVNLQTEASRRVSLLRDASRTADRYSRDLLDLARQSVEISRTRYESGQGSILEWIDSERSRLDLEMQYWNAVAVIARQQLALQLLTGPNLSGSATPALSR